LKVKDL
jgi:hypothetical protein